MNGLFAAFTLDKEFLPSEEITTAFDSLSVFGRSHRQLEVSERWAMGCQASHTLESDNHCLPLHLSHEGSDSWFIFDGRLDNKAELAALLGADMNQSDAEICLAYLQANEFTDLSAIVGPYVFVYLDLNAQRLVAGRDPMGGRALLHTFIGSTLVIASDELAFLAFTQFDASYNQEKIARSLAHGMESRPSSFFSSLNWLNPGERLSYDVDGISFERYYRPPEMPDVRTSGLAENAIRFRTLLDQAVLRRLRTSSASNKVGILLSGGLDSTPVASSAATQSNNVTEVAGFSWAFPETAESDETDLSRPLCQQLGIHQYLIDCEALSLGTDSDYLQHDPRTPFLLPYAIYQAATFEKAQQEGFSVLLGGMYGDLLYAGADNILISSLRNRGLKFGLAQFAALIKAQGSLWKALKRYVFLQVPWVKSWVRGRTHKPPGEHPILVDGLLPGLVRERHWLAGESDLQPRTEQYENLLGSICGEDAHYGRRLEVSYGIERRNPFRDRDLCEFMLNVPSEQLYALGITRPILREAFKDDLPEAILARVDKTEFMTALNRHIADSEATK
ncbi:MAG: asparagine synthase-related protein, partial [Pseudomonadota bacterium]